MEHIKLFEDFSELENISEDFLELKSIVKQLYSVLKNTYKYEVKIKEDIKKSTYRGGDTLVGTKDSKPLNNKGGAITIAQFTDVEQIGVFIPAHAVAYQFINSEGNKDLIRKMRNKKDDWDIKDWSHISDEIFKGNRVYNLGRRVAGCADIMRNEEAMKFIEKMGEDLDKIIKSKYPNMLLSYENNAYDFCLYFKEPTTKKGAVVNPKQRASSWSNLGQNKTTEKTPVVEKLKNKFNRF